MQFHSGAQITSSLTQCVTLRFSPCSPFDDDYKTEFE